MARELFYLIGKAPGKLNLLSKTAPLGPQHIQAIHVVLL